MIEEYRGKIGKRRLCELSSVSKTAYYLWRKKREEKSDQGNFLLKEIEKIVEEFPGYGYRRVTATLKRGGFRVNHKRILRVMRENNLIKKRKKKRISTTFSFHNYPLYPNLIKGLIPKRPDEIWVADITYIRLKEGFSYLAALIDAFSRTVVGWALRDNLTSELSLSALRMALSRRKIKPGLIHHSDRGSQYASKEYTSLLKAHRILISMSKKGNPYENALAESFIATLKKEEVNMCEYEDMNEALLRIGYFIEDLYNRKRLHSSLGYQSPAEFEKKFNESVLI